MANPPSLVLHGAARAHALPAADTRRTAREQIGLAVERVGRGALARMRRSRLLRWRYSRVATTCRHYANREASCSVGSLPSGVR